MENLNKRLDKLKELLGNEFDNDYINYDDVYLDNNSQEYTGTIEINGECEIYCVLNDDYCNLSFTNISFDVYYTIDDIRELCNKLDNISESLS